MTTLQKTETDPAWDRLINQTTDPGRRERGIKYAANGNVITLRIRGDQAHALVEGREDSPYNVYVNVDENNSAPHLDELDCQCDCEDAVEVCKHIVAVMTLISQRAAHDNPATDQPNHEMDYAPDYEHDDNTATSPQRWSRELPTNPAEFWNAGSMPDEQPANEQKQANILKTLGDFSGWNATPPFKTIMGQIYESASHTAFRLLGIPQPKPQSETADQHTVPAQPQPLGHQEFSSRCDCPTCVSLHNAAYGDDKTAREDTVLPGMYDEYLLSRGFAWTPCGRRLQPQ